MNEFVNIFLQVFYPYFELCIALCCILRLKEKCMVLLCWEIISFYADFFFYTVYKTLF